MGFCGLRYFQVPLTQVMLTCHALSPVLFGFKLLLMTMLLVQSQMALAEVGNMAGFQQRLEKWWQLEESSAWMEAKIACQGCLWSPTEQAEGSR